LPSPLIARRGLIAFLGAAVVSPLVPACATAKPPVCQPKQPTLKVEPLEILTARGPARFQVELADNARTREIGMMCRTALAPDRGMLFDFKTPQEVAFWMHNTLIPLDMLFIGADGRVFSMATARPRDDTPVPAGGPVRAVLEIPGGRARQLGVLPGDQVVHRIFRRG
jgi:uncharacterized membrane protein (UPF0127 family)